MASAEFKFDLRELDGLAELLDGARLSSDDRRQLLTDIGTEVEAQTQERFDNQRDPQGNPWQQLAEKTREWYVRNGMGHGFLLDQSGGLRDSLTMEVDDWPVLVGATKIYAATHQYGRGGIPARPYLGMSSSNANEIMELARNFIAGRL